MKKALSIILVLVMALSLFAGCAPADDSTTTAPNGTTTGKTDTPPAGEAKVPTEEGKITFMFTLADASVAQEEFISYYITGGCFGWKTGLEAPVFTNLEGTKIYYIIWEGTIDPAADQGLDYQLKIGYNEKSGAADLGLTWTLDSWKSDECAAPGGVNNLAFTYEAGQQIVDLGTHTFSTKAEKPVAISTTLVLNFAEALPEGYTVAIRGGFNNWGNSGEETFMTTTDNKKFSYALTDVALNEYEFKVLVYPEGAYNPDDAWTGAVLYGLDGVAGANDNAKIKLSLIDADGELDIFDIELVLPAAE